MQRFALAGQCPAKAAGASQPYPRAIAIWRKIDMSNNLYAACIDACTKCAQACEHCADACLGEPEVAKMAECIRADLDCADICWATAAWMSRESQFAHDLCSLCAEVCDACARECEPHQADHCQQCAAACRQCAEECRQMVSAAA